MKVNLPTATLGLQPFDGWLEVEFVGTTIDEMIADIERRYLNFSSWCLHDGVISGPVSFRLNGRDVRLMQGKETKLTEGDHIVLVSDVTMLWNG